MTSTPVTSPAVFSTTSKVRFYVPQLDGLRFFAFLLVFFHHMNGMGEVFGRNTIGGRIFGFIELWGWCGVDLFLVLSAYLITTLLLIEHEREGAISLRGFYLRRILRIWPLYYLMCLVGFLILPWFGLFAPVIGSPQHSQLIKTHLLPYLTLFGNFSSGSHWYPMVWTLAHLWTVTLEEQFYIVWPLILIFSLHFLGRKIWVLLLLLLLGTIGLRLYFRGHTSHPFIWTHTLSRLDPLLMGIALALWRKSHPLHPGWLVPVIKFTLGIVTVWLVSMGPVIETQSSAVVWQFFATALGFVLILDAILSSNRNPLAWIFSGRPLVWLGKLTYGLYVYHILGIQFGSLLSDWVRPQRWIKSHEGVIVLRLSIAFALTVLIAAISYRFFESFFLRLKDKFSSVKSRPVGKVVS
jgi:peptidoglycan/LPS O-acetylase OafA/YrhL